MRISDKHNLYLSRRVWGELKQRAYQERSSASDIVTFLLDGFLQKRPAGLDLSRYQARLPDDGEQRRGRSVYIPAETWDAIEKRSKEEEFSVTGLAEALIKDYLGIAPLSSEPEESEGSPSGNLIKVDDRTFDLGENPIRINMKGEELPKRSDESP